MDYAHVRSDCEGVVLSTELITNPERYEPEALAEDKLQIKQLEMPSYQAGHFILEKL